MLEQKPRRVRGGALDESSSAPCQEARRPTERAKQPRARSTIRRRWSSVRSERERWEETTVAKATQRMPEQHAETPPRSRACRSSGSTRPRTARTSTTSATSAFPGEYPYTRGVQPTMYRAKPWTMRMFAGFGTAEETNERFKYLLAQGQTGLSIAFDMPTLYGYDTDHPLALGEFGKCGVAVSSLADMEVLFDGIPLDEVTTSMTINSPALGHLGDVHRGAPRSTASRWRQLGGTLQNDILKEYIAQNEFLFPPEPSMRLVVGHDRVRHAQHAALEHGLASAATTSARPARPRCRSWPSRWPTASPTSNAALERGLDVDEFAPRLSFFFDVHNDFFEEIAKFRAARRIWARDDARALRREETRARGCCAPTRRRRASR